MLQKDYGKERLEDYSTSVDYAISILTLLKAMSIIYKIFLVIREYFYNTFFTLLFVSIVPLVCQILRLTLQCNIFVYVKSILVPNMKIYKHLRSLQ